MLWMMVVVTRRHDSRRRHHLPAIRRERFMAVRISLSTSPILLYFTTPHEHGIVQPTYKKSKPKITKKPKIQTISYKH